MPNETTQAHSLHIEGRTRLRIAGVTDVLNFDETNISAETVVGTLHLHGEGLHIERLHLEQGELLISGMLQALEYDEEQGARNGFFGRLFG